MTSKTSSRIPPEASPQILLIEDNPGDARYIQEMIREAEEFSERTFASGGILEESTRQQWRGSPALVHETRLEAGLQRMKERRPDVVLLDLNLPDSDGLDTLTAVVQHDESVPVVVLTGVHDREMGMDALRRGAEEYLVKDEINPDLLIRSIYHAIERKAHKREQKRYETLIEESTDVNAIVDPDGTIQYITPSAEHVLGYAPTELIEGNVFEYIHPDDRESARDEFDAMDRAPDYRATVEFRFEHAEGFWIVLHARGRNLLDDSAIRGMVVYTRDITERKEYERRLERQRERLAALNQLNGVVQSITEAVIERSTRKEIEQIVCDRLAQSKSYEFAWIGEPDPQNQAVISRAKSGVAGSLEEVTISTDPEDEEDSGPTGRALKTGEIQTTQDVHSDPEYEPWREVAETYGFQSSAAAPISYDGTIYGVLNVYADRLEAFQREEQTVIEHLGEIIGHAIAAAERKQALMSESVVELEFRVPNVFEALEAPESADGAIAIYQVLPIGGDDFLVYGTAPERAMAAVETITEESPAWEELRVVSEEADKVRFELRVSEPPVMSEVASLGGSIERVVIEGGDLDMTVRLPQQAEVRQIVQTVQETYPQAEPVARRQLTEKEDPSQQLQHVWTSELTDRQRTVLETAYFSGFFEWPRAASGEDVAKSLNISAPTFSQHLRAAENKIFGGLLGVPPD